MAMRICVAAPSRVRCPRLLVVSRFKPAAMRAGRPGTPQRDPPPASSLGRTAAAWARSSCGVRLSARSARTEIRDSPRWTSTGSRQRTTTRATRPAMTCCATSLPRFAQAPSYDPLTRWGGDEFVCAVSSTSVEKRAIASTTPERSLPREAWRALSFGLAAACQR
jgi:hypothetical protein